MEEPSRVVHSSRWSVRIAVLIFFIVAESSHFASASLYPSLTPDAGLWLSKDSACYKDSIRFQSAFNNRTIWAARMMDASALNVVGGLWGSRFQLGSFDACMSAGTVSPVGARYCLATLTASPPLPASGQPHPCDGPSPGVWDHVTGLDPGLDAGAALQGCGMAPGSIPLGEVLVALCVPDSCDAHALQSALQASAKHSESGTSGSLTGLEVRVDEEHCVSRTELDNAPRNVVATLFWCFCAALSTAVVLAPFFGWEALNWRKHFHAMSLPEAPLAGLDLNALSGIKFINAVLLLGVHRSYHVSHMSNTNNILTTAESRTSPWHVLGHHATLLVDTSFFMSSLLVTLAMTTNRHRSTLRQLVNRYLRLTPAYAMVILFYASAMESAGSGPLWKAVTTREATACRRWWWTNLLYINNYVRGELGETSCMLQSWSLSVDMQQYVVASLLLPLVLPRGTAGRVWPLLLALLVAVALPFQATLRHGWPATLLFTPRAVQNIFAQPSFVDMYVAAHMRAAPFVVGIAVAGIMLRIKAGGASLSPRVSTWMTAGSLTILLAILLSSTRYGDPVRSPRHVLEVALYASLSPALWAAALGVLVISLTFGQRSTIEGLLRWQPMVTLSRLTYCMYLVHFAVQLLEGAAARSPTHLTVLSTIKDGFGDLSISLFVSLWLHLAVEAPIRHLVTMIFNRTIIKAKHVD